MERISRIDIPNKCMEMCVEYGEHDYFEFAIAADWQNPRTNSRIWAGSTLYGRWYEIENALIPRAAAGKAFLQVFPLSKWGIEMDQGPFFVDGPYFHIALHEYCDIYLSSTKFSFEAAHEMQNYIVDEIIKKYLQVTP